MDHVHAQYHNKGQVNAQDYHDGFMGDVNAPNDGLLSRYILQMLVDNGEEKQKLIKLFCRHVANTRCCFFVLM